jgi:light-harvesting complex I chlorophyll a/b binding protein 1
MASSGKRSAISATTLGATAGLASFVGGAAFISGTNGSSAQHTAALRATAQNRQTAASVTSAGQQSSDIVQVGLGGMAFVSVGALLARSAMAGGSPLKASNNLCCTALRAFENELGVQEPVGFWDPAGFTADGDLAKFKRRRSVELKHGRICMMATMGYITPEVIGKLPGYLSPSAGLKFADIPNGLAAVSKVPTAGWAQIAAYFGFVEFAGGFTDYKTGTPGDYGFKVLTSSDPAEKTKKLAAEIANGRLAMVAIIGMFFQDGLTGSAWGDWALYTASPLR